MATAEPTARSSHDVPTKMSRYRSVRRAEQALKAAAPPVPDLPANDTESQAAAIQRSMSRYKAPRQATSGAGNTSMSPKASQTESSGSPKHATPPIPRLPQNVASVNKAQKKQYSEGMTMPVRTDTSTSLSTSLSNTSNHSPLQKTISHRIEPKTSSPQQHANAPAFHKPLHRSKYVVEQTSAQHAPPLKMSSAPNLNRAKAQTSAEALRPTNRTGPIAQNTLQQTNFSQPHVRPPREEAKQLMEAEAERQRKIQRRLRAEKETAMKEERERQHRNQKLEQDIANEAQRQAQEEWRREAQAKELEQRRQEHDKKRQEAIHAEAKQRAKSSTQQKSRPADQSSQSLDPPVIANGIGPRPSTPREIFGFLKKRKGDEVVEGSKTLVATSQTSPPRKDESGPFRGLLAGGTIGAAVATAPGADAPVSAVNAGERRVTVECGHSSMMFPVNPTTTPVELIKAASTVMSEPIDYKASVLLESFGKVGVQRPLRKYEHVRDVMNSWDEDRQNSLILVPSATGGNDPDLEEASIPTEQPASVSFYMHYSQKPGKWEKRWVTLRQDGQITQSKRETDTSKDVVNVCHLSDFDIYTPQAKAAARKIKPPKKHCFAIKSQQKSAMFLSLDNFVHFFCTSDKNVAAEWYRAVQGWRSWYLVNVLGEGTQHQHAATSDVPGSKNDALQIPGSRDSHYQLGSFQPLLDLDLFAANPKTDTNDDFLSSVQKAGSQTTQPSRTAPSSWQQQHNRLQSTNDSTHTRNFSSSTSPHHRTRSSTTSAAENNSNVFAATGLLGRQYTQRQKAQRERESAAQDQSPFTGGLLSDTITTPEKPSDTLITTVLHNTQPQTSSGAPKGRGFVPDTIGPGGLVDNATGPSRRSIDRARSTRHRAKSSSFNGGRISVDTGSTSDRHHSDIDIADGSLLAQALSAGHSLSTSPEKPRGRGIMQGTAAARTGQPMLDLRENSIFAGGSLLRKVEGDDNGVPRVGEIDRRKDREVEIRVGEAV